VRKCLCNINRDAQCVTIGAINV